MQSQADEVKTGAAAVARTAAKNPMLVLASLMSSHPASDIGWLFRKWSEQVQKDEELLEAALRHTFQNMLHSLDRPTVDRRRIDLQQTRSANIQREARQIADRVVNVVLMNLTLPSGKVLRDATFKECARAGGFFLRVAKKGKPQQIVGKTLTEADLQALRL